MEITLVRITGGLSIDFLILYMLYKKIQSAQVAESKSSLRYFCAGKYINCYNYDGSYRNFSTNSSETGTATPNRETDYAAFGLGRIVTLEITSPTNLAGTTSAQIIDRWNHTGSTAGPTTDP